MRKKYQRISGGRRGGRFGYGFNTWRASRRGVNAGTVRRAGRRSRRRGRRGKALLLLAALLLCAAAVFLLRPAYIHSQQDKITDSLIESFLNGGERPVFAEPDRLVLKSEEIKGSPVYIEKEYAERETVGLSPVGMITLEPNGVRLPIVLGTDTVRLRYAVGCAEYPQENGMLTLYGRSLAGGERLFSALDTLSEGSGIILADGQGESRYTVSASEKIEKTGLEEKLAALTAENETGLLLITADKEDEEKLLLVYASREENGASQPELTPEATLQPAATPVPTHSNSPVPAATAEVKTPEPTAAPTATPKATKRPARRTPTPEPTAEPTPTPDGGFSVKQTPDVSSGFGGQEATPSVSPPAAENTVVPDLPDDGGLDTGGGAQ